MQLVGDDILVPCIIREDIPDSEVLKVQLEENIQRKQMSAIELVEAFDKIKAQSRVKVTNERLATMLNKNVSWILSQYYAVKNIEKVYGDNGKEYVRNNHIAAGKIIGDLQKKNREVTKVQKDGFAIEYRGKSITIKCESVDVVNYVLAELKKI